MEILADLHTHTVESGHAYSTITENAAAAARKGLKLLGMTGHGPSMPGAIANISPATLQSMEGLLF